MKNKLDTILRPDHPINVEDPTRITSHNKWLIDFLITDKYLKTLLVATFESLISSDQFAQLITSITVIGTKNSADQTYFTKGTIIKTEFQKTIGCSNWREFYTNQDAKKKLFEFEKFFSKAIQMHAPIQKIYVRIEKAL